jgi:hypothetical protein
MRRFVSDYFSNFAVICASVRGSAREGRRSVVGVREGQISTDEVAGGGLPRRLTEGAECVTVIPRVKKVRSGSM